jgi:stage II sporulation protein P
LTGDGPTVLILHSHATESYTKKEDYQETAPYRTLSTDHNMVSVGAQMAAILEDAGIGVIHDTTLHDYPSYNSSYINSRAKVGELLEQYPTVKLVLDLHRDAGDTSGKQPRYTVDTPDGTAAQVMMVVGTDAGGRNHPAWRENMALAVKLHARLEQNIPGICRPISLRSDRFNQDLSPGAMLIEVGAAGNTRQEALAAAVLLAEGIIDLARGCVTEDFAS